MASQFELKPLLWSVPVHLGSTCRTAASTILGAYECCTVEFDGRSTSCWRAPDGIHRIEDDLETAMVVAEAHYRSTLLAEIVVNALGMDIEAAVQSERDRCKAWASSRQLKSHPRLEAGPQTNAWWSGQEVATQDILAGIKSGEHPKTAASS